MTSDDKPETQQPVFHGAPSRPEPPTENPPEKEIKINKALAAGLVFGIGSAALVAALLYARRTKAKAPPKLAPEPSD